MEKLTHPAERQLIAELTGKQTACHAILCEIMKTPLQPAEQQRPTPASGKACVRAAPLLRLDFFDRYRPRRRLATRWTPS